MTQSSAPIATDRSGAMTEEEKDLAHKAINAGNIYLGWVIFCVVIFASATGFYAASQGRESEVGWNFGLGCAGGVVVGLPFLFRARMQVLDQQRRHLYMDRT